ncbi:hypothetical protein [Azospirillum brasilense]|uniref:hypothetical protein n=1 Tax=Azospirillum brasilense TaxID=192 RepID=UPI000E68E5FB|nr:hypothetical protein [Azospirillum brasilense]NUB24882.1 hypothetical protein [Azospirillum brasilense]NUB32557.1 hypothetical protein [Azospirillum brasilense]RIW02077.1 hypothetical protein D2T81_16600 [Azospirillum brasilense]
MTESFSTPPRRSLDSPAAGGSGHRWIDDIDALLADGEDESDDRRPAAARAGFTGHFDGAILMAACAATAAITRLDERLVAASPYLRRGWQERWLLRSTIASMALDGRGLDEDDLRLDSIGALSRAADADLRVAREILSLSRHAARRTATKNLFAAPRLMALLRPPATVIERRLRNRRAQVDAAIEAGADERFLEIIGQPVDRVVARRGLEDALDPNALDSLATMPPVLGAVMLLARWHATAAPSLGAAPGRILADHWLRHAGLTRAAIGGIAVGFGRGARQDYEPCRMDTWAAAGLAAVRRSAEAGLALLNSLESAERAILERDACAIKRALESGERTRASRRDRVFEGLLHVLVERPAASLPQIQAAMDTTRPRYQRRTQGGIADMAAVPAPSIENPESPPLSRKRAGEEVVRRHISTLERRGHVVQMRHREDGKRAVMRIYRLVGC